MFGSAWQPAWRHGSVATISRSNGQTPQSPSRQLKHLSRMAERFSPLVIPVLIPDTQTPILLPDNEFPQAGLCSMLHRLSNRGAEFNIGVARCVVLR